MTDASGVYSEDIYYTLNEHGDGTYVLGVIASESWMNAADRSFPVKIDPAVYSLTRETANGLTLYYGSSASREYNQSRIKFGTVNSVTCDAFISFPNENDQFYLSDYQLVYSKLKYYVRSVGNSTTGATEYCLRTAKSTLPLEAVNSFAQISYNNSQVLLNGTIKSYKSWFTTKHEARWEEAYFNPEAFDGCADMVFMWFYKKANGNQHGEVDVRDGNLPSVLNYYVSTVGIKEDLPYEQFEYNGGTADVNLLNGAVTASFSALSIDVPENPISLELIYNDDYNDIMTEFGMYNMFGNNIKINFQQTIKHDTRAVRYIDADGSIDTLSTDLNASYSVNRSITYMPDDNSLYIGGKTRLLFNGNKSYKYYDAKFLFAEKPMYEIFYSEDKISQIAGYTNGTKTHYISLAYNSDGRVSVAQSYIAADVTGHSFQSLAKCEFTYDSDGNLTQIKNSNSGHNKYTLDYYEGRLRGVTDFDGNGYLFGRTHWTSTSPMRMSVINYIYGLNTSYGNYYRYEYVSFNSDAKTTHVTYYDSDGNRLGERNVSRRYAKGTQSEWYEDDKGELSISTQTSEMTGSSEASLQYTRNAYFSEKKSNTTLSDTYNSIAPGGSLTGSITTGHGIASKNGRRYCVGLSIQSIGTSFVEVLVGGEVKGKISLNGATDSWFIFPVDYYSGSASIQIKNTGNNYISVSDAFYNYYTSTNIVKRIETTTMMNYVSSTETRSKDYKKTVNYNFLGEITSANETDYTESTSKNYTYTYEDYPGIATRSEYDARRLKSISDGTKEATYEYSSNGSLNSVVTTTVKQNSVKQSKKITETNGALGEYYIITTENGLTVRTDYGVKGGNVRAYKVTVGDSVTEYAYNYDGEITSIKTGDLVQKTYYSGDNGKESSYYIGSSEYYTLTRDSSKFGLITGISQNGSRKLTMEYNENGDILSTTYANGATINYTYDYRELQRAELKDSSSSVATDISYGYDGGNLTSVTQSQNGVTQLAYQFTDSKTQSKLEVSGEVNASYTYNYDEDNGRLTNRIIDIENGAKTRAESFVYDNHGVLQSNGDAEFCSEYTYDAYERMATKTQKVGSTVRQKLQYSYSDTSEYKSKRVSSIYNPQNGARQNYTYNTRGFIASYSNSLNSDGYNYTYDAQGRLKRDGRYEYVYDNQNNIVRVDKIVGDGLQTVSEYTYWTGMRLKSITENGTSKYFYYDSMGNITTYKNSSAAVSQNLYYTRGNMLSGAVLNGKNITYRYGADNLRYGKSVDGTETLYYWDDDILMGEKTGANYTQYIYDASGIIGMIYNGAYYYFEKNLFGDVLRVYTASGTIAASFSYDSYGNIISQSGSTADKVHFRYRGYYYDEETGFYYLQSRYYDPSIRRFISADQYELVPYLSDSLGELNLYAYCANNPIMYTDESGESFSLTTILVSMLICGAVFGVLSGVSAYQNGVRGLDLASNIIYSIGSGLLTGFVVGVGIATISVGAGILGGSGLLALAGGGVEGGAIALAGVGVIVAGGVIVVEGVAVGV